MQVMIEKEAEDFLEDLGFPVARRVFSKTSQAAVKDAKKLGFPIAMKVVSKKALHKSDVGGVLLNLRTAEDIKQGFHKMKKIKGFEGVLLQEYREGASVLIGLKQDPTFGHVLVCGAGGIYTEIMKDVAFRVCPVTKHDVLDMLNELKIYEVLKGARGQSYDLNRLVQVLMALSNLTKTNPEIKELDVNPLLVMKKDVLVVDARVVFD